MNARFATLISIFLFTLSLSGCVKCDRTLETSVATSNFEGKTLFGTVTLGTGVFADMKGYTFKASFLTDQLFKTTNSKNDIESQGDYQITIINNQTVRLTLTDRGGEKEGQVMEATLKFSSSTAGTYDARLLTGQQGEQNGTFQLK